MKLAYKDGEEMPGGTERKTVIVEPAESGYWCHDKDRRSAGKLPNTPLSEILKWILQQMNYGHVEYLADETGDIVGLKIGQEVPYEVADAEAAEEKATKAGLSLNLVGLVAETREKGTSPKTRKLEEMIWKKATADMRGRMEIHYGRVLCELLGRVSKKIPTLELLPIMEHAPERTREYLAEATRCHLFKLDRACIALCRACLEGTLKSILTKEMKQNWFEEMELNKRRWKNPNPMAALVEVCARQGVLGRYAMDAHYVREKANDVLHSNLRRGEAPKADVAGTVLKKTRLLIGWIHGNSDKRDQH